MNDKSENSIGKYEKKNGPLPEFFRPNLLPVSLVITLFTKRSHYKLGMKSIGIDEENWYAWPKPREAWVTTYQNGKKRNGVHVVCCIGDTEGLDGIDIAAVLCHEAVHVWQAYCEHIGERRPADEQSAYAIQSISSSFMREFVRLKSLDEPAKQTKKKKFK